MYLAIYRSFHRTFWQNRKPHQLDTGGVTIYTVTYQGVRSPWSEPRAGSEPRGTSLFKTERPQQADDCLSLIMAQSYTGTPSLVWGFDAGLMLGSTTNTENNNKG